MKKASLYKLLKRAQRGSIMVFFVMLIPVLFGFMGFGIDFGLAYVQKGKLQDVADATALAAAVHLGESGQDRMDKIEAAVKSSVETNGLTLGNNSLVQKAAVSEEYGASGQDLAAEWAGPVTLAEDQNVAVEYGVVSVTKDGNATDRVRVRITKRSPIFFLGVLGDFSDGLIVSAKAAAEGDSEEIKIIDQFLVDGPGLIAFGNKLNLYTGQTRGVEGKNGKGIDKDIYVNGTLNYTGNGNFKTEANIYANDTKGVTVDKDQIVDLDNKTDEAEQMVAKVKEITDKCDNILKNVDVNEFKNGTGGNKVYINKDGIWPPDISIVTGKVYDVYIDATGINYSNNTQYSIITNDVLRNIDTINNLYINSSNQNGVILNTEYRKFNNIYIKGNAFVEGHYNQFRGRVYSNAELNVLGSNNQYVQLLGQTLNVGRGFNGGGSIVTANSSWKFYIDAPSKIGSGEAGNGSSGSTSGGAVTKLRLVE